MNKYVKAFFVFIFWWAIFGTGISVIFAFLGIKNLDIIGPLIGFSLGIYKAVRIIRHSGIKSS